MSLNVFFVLPEAIALVVLIIHSLYRRGIKETLFFFTSGFIYFSVKENLTALNLFQHGRYRFNHIQFPIYKAPLFVICGWVFAAYLSLTLAEGIVRRIKGESGDFFMILVASLFITSSIAYAVEVCGVTAGWWDWPYHRKVASAEDQARIIYGIYTPIYGWARFINGFIAPYLLFRKSNIKLKKNRLMLLFLSYVVVLGSLLTKFYNFQMTGLLELTIIFSVLFFSGLKVDIYSDHGLKPDGWPARHGVLLAALLMLSVCWIIPIVSKASPRVYVSTFAFTTFLLLYVRWINFRVVAGFIVVSYAISYFFNKPEISFAFVQVFLVFLFFILRKIFQNYLYLINKSPQKLSAPLITSLFALLTVGWLILVIGIQHGLVIKEWVPDFGP